MTIKQDLKSPVGTLILISICLIGALSTWFSATVVLPEISDQAQLS